MPLRPWKLMPFPGLPCKGTEAAEETAGVHKAEETAGVREAKETAGVREGVGDGKIGESMLRSDRGPAPAHGNRFEIENQPVESDSARRTNGVATKRRKSKGKRGEEDEPFSRSFCWSSTRWTSRMGRTPTRPRSGRLRRRNNRQRRPKRMSLMLFYK